MSRRKPKTESEFDRAFRTARIDVEGLSLAELYALFQRTIVELFCRGEEAGTIHQLRHQADLLEKSLARRGEKPVEHSLSQRWGSIFEQKPMGYEPKNKGQPRAADAGPDMNGAPPESAPVDVANRIGLATTVARENFAWLEDDEDQSDQFTDKGEETLWPEDQDDAAAQFIKQQGAAA